MLAKTAAFDTDTPHLLLQNCHVYKLLYVSNLQNGRSCVYSNQSPYITLYIKLIVLTFLLLLDCHWRPASVDLTGVV